LIQTSLGARGFGIFAAYLSASVLFDLGGR